MYLKKKTLIHHRISYPHGCLLSKHRAVNQSFWIPIGRSSSETMLPNCEQLLLKLHRHDWVVAGTMTSENEVEGEDEEGDW